ncbi:MAG TPA: zf-HC2 domain-containing protein [Vicinamibacterales bacterium]|jgi:anti-sigma factor RsiW|nr:zf-HC2 domain-containing protein [Vicinamibacterales bacterium]
MSECDCTSVDRLATAYVDDDLGVSERQRVAQHLLRCPPCHARIAAEQAVRRVIASQKSDLQSARASEGLHTRCRAVAVSGATPAWRAHLVPLTLAALLTLIVGGAFLYQLTARSATVMAAQLTADHMKCFAVNGLLGTHQEQGTVESALASGFGWHAQLPDGSQEDLALVGSRPCFYGEGRIAHIMYVHDGHPVSLFMLPHSRRTEAVVSVLGHEATIWSVGDRTFVLITEEKEDSLQRLASFVRASLH